ncbi:MAG: nucleoside transporter C-terminal domain-containing protein [Pirellulales bacterium]
MERWISVLGLFVMIFLAWCMSSHRSRVNWRLVVIGVGLQLVFGVLVLKTKPGMLFFDFLGGLFDKILNNVDVGAKFVFGDSYMEHPFAFRVLPTIILFSALMSILYHVGVMQVIVRWLAVIMQKTLGTSGAESLSTAANIFVGQTEAPLVIKPYVATMTQSELMAIMVGGFATIAGGVLAAFVSMGINAGDLMTASVMAAPATIVIAKIVQPEVEEPLTRGSVKLDVEKTADNVVHAAANGASEGVQLAINVAGMLLAFLAIVAMFNGVIGWTGEWFGYLGKDIWTLEKGLGYVFFPMAWVMGIPSDDCERMGQLLGIRLIASEFQSYSQLALWMDPEAIDYKPFQPRSIALITYALCGFATFASIGIQIGGIGPSAPKRVGDIAKLGFCAMLAGNLASFMTACVAGMLLSDADFAVRADETRIQQDKNKRELQQKLEKEGAEQLKKLVNGIKFLNDPDVRELNDEQKASITKDREALRKLLQEAQGAWEKSVPPLPKGESPKLPDSPPPPVPPADFKSSRNAPMRGETFAARRFRFASLPPPINVAAA